MTLCSKTRSESSPARDALIVFFKARKHSPATLKRYEFEIQPGAADESRIIRAFGDGDIETWIMHTMQNLLDSSANLLTWLTWLKGTAE